MYFSWMTGHSKCLVIQNRIKHFTWQVNETEYGRVDIYELVAGQPKLERKELATMRVPKDIQGNLCRVEDLFVDNKMRLDNLVCLAVAKVASGPSKPTAAEPAQPRVQFRRVKIAGDGRCGWRCILAASQLELYESVARTVQVQNPVRIRNLLYIYIYVCMLCM